MRYPLSITLSILLFGCTSPEEEVCVDNQKFFEEEVWPKVASPTCMTCHTPDGAAKSSGFVLTPLTLPGAMEANYALMENLAGLERDGDSILVLKPQGLENHGGGQVLTEESEGLELLRDFVARTKAPVVCIEDDEPVLDPGQSLVLASHEATLRKASLLLVGRVPTAEELDIVAQGGEQGLTTVLWSLMAEPTFPDRVAEWMNDILLTDRFLLSRDGLSLIDLERFPSGYWFEDEPYQEGFNTYRNRASQAAAVEPMNLVKYLVAEERPWTELLTADYTVVNGFSALNYGVSDLTGTADGVTLLDDPEAASVLHEVKLPEYPHAGILTTPAFLARYPTTATNRNRHRSWYFFKTFLGTDILTYGDRPLDADDGESHNPTLNDSQCTICHDTMDPVAGAFQNWDEVGAYRPPAEGWYPDLKTPGFGEETLPGADSPQAIRWLAQKTVQDPRFAAATVKMFLERLTGLPLLTAELAANDPVKTEALAQQDAWIAQTAVEFEERGYDIKWVVEQIVLSHWFRAIADDGASEGTLHLAGTAHLLTPEELHRKIESTLGIPWRTSVNGRDLLLDDYRLMYGGLDSFSVVERLDTPNGILNAVQLRAATDLACRAASYDFTKARENRILFPKVEMSWTPETEEGFAVPEVEQAITDNLLYLYDRLLGTTPSEEEVQAAYELWFATWKDGVAAMDAETQSVNLPNKCQARTDWATGENFPNDERLIRDDEYTIRAWMVVIAYLVSDYEFLYE